MGPDRRLPNRYGRVDRRLPRHGGARAAHAGVSFRLGSGARPPRLSHGSVAPRAAGQSGRRGLIRRLLHARVGFVLRRVPAHARRGTRRAGIGPLLEATPQRGAPASPRAAHYAASGSTLNRAQTKLSFGRRLLVRDTITMTCGTVPSVNSAASATTSSS